ncbi:MAG TPA: O-antigen ligase family protein [Cyclobacteriaceae bacterium]|nr:O-antigen ligase family protein [Cyclobacteriaceae bacterium]
MINKGSYGYYVYACFLVFVFTIPISTFVSTRLLFVALVLSFFLKWDGNFINRLVRNSWEIFFYLIVLAFGILYSEDKSLAGRVLETSFSLAAIPLVVAKFGDVERSKIRNIIYAFTLGVVVAGLVCLVNATIRYYQTSDRTVFVFNELTDIIGSHPTYLAYYIIFVLTVWLYWLYDNEAPMGRFRWLPLCVFLFGLLILTGGHTAYISLLLIFSFFILKTITEAITKDKVTLASTIVLMLVAMFIVNSLDYWGNQAVLRNDYWERSSLWEAAIRANWSPLFGVGTGDYNLVLNKYYMTHGLEKFALESLNSHNQFIQIYLSNGLLGVVAMIILLGRPLITAVGTQQSLVKLAFFPFVIYGMNEVFLGRYQGVVFFALLHQIIACYNATVMSPSLPKTA